MPEAMFTSSSISSGFLHTSLDEVNETVIMEQEVFAQREKMESALDSRWLIKAGYYGSCCRLGHAGDENGIIWAHRSSAIKCPGDLVTCKFLWGVSWKNPARSGILTLFMNCHKLTPYDPNNKFPSTLSTSHFQQFPSFCKAVYSSSYLQHYQLIIC